MSLGTLTIEVLEAHLTRDTQTVGKMDPYVKIKCRDFQWKSETDKNGGKKPEWKHAKFEIDVKYLGDDLEFALFDEDKGRDEKIGDGESKLSAFCCQPSWDEWFVIEHKGRSAGKLHLKSHWAPSNPAHHENDEMSEIQALLKEAVAKKRELEAEFNLVKDKQHDDAEASAARIAAAEAERDSHNWDAQAAQAEEALAAALAAAEAMRQQQHQNKEDFERDLAEEVRVATEVRDALVSGFEGQEAEAAAVRDAALAQAEQNKEAGHQAHLARQAAVEAEILEEQRHDKIDHDHVTDEIKVVAEKLLAINAQIQHHLEELTKL